MRWLFTQRMRRSNDLRFPRIPPEAEAAAARAQGQPPRLSDLWMQARAPLDKLWNVYSFFVTYANIDGFNPTTRRLPVSRAQRPGPLGALRAAGDGPARWTERLADFDASARGRPSRAFIENLSNWYVRRSRRRFWKAEEDADKVAAYLTLYECLVTVTKLLAPFTPFLAESLYQNLVRSVDASAPESVHLCDWPVADASLISPRLRDETALVHAAGEPGSRSAREGADSRASAAEPALRARRRPRTSARRWSAWAIRCSTS